MSDLETLKAQHPELMTRFFFSAQNPECFAGGEGYWVSAKIFDALVALIQRHEAELGRAQETIADLRHRAADRHHDAVDAESERDQAKRDLAAAQATIATLRDSLQQRERELEEAEHAVLWIALHEEADDTTAKVYHRALANESARAQQAEAKKEG